MIISRRAFGLGGAVLLGWPAAGHAQQPVFFRIGTGATGGNYYPIGSLVATAISQPPGSRDCADCGVPGLVASAITTDGSVANAAAVQSGALESGFVQGDVAAFAYSGTEMWHDRPPAQDLRAIANLYPDTIHVVADASAGIATIADLRGKRVAMGERFSGTRVDANLILAAAGLDESQIDAQQMSIDAAADALGAGKLDALFFSAGHPAVVLARLASQRDIAFIPIDGTLRDRILAAHSFFLPQRIAAGTYQDQSVAVETISVGAQWLTSARQSDELIYQITRALWRDRSQTLLAAAFGGAAIIRRENALSGLTIPLHPGAARFYRETGLLR
ncbi:TAXI family TRAP transporter solute-binding subunit [Paracoccus shanxieyensis]|uniref:TAXI family TRAP transporter solute-binding subunit n=1 Tax=Paracoccus shanxieyensis TaxID=2675752 RepID=A0A6L6J0T9_9RHOB|nr:TAXI family TRAP transporter solute-binding subunit [Paracoccus shanxieyensis]MTH66365.1 TAXI family TRAP transporter solute-binding subunit [Paracoccus shanxieyensis]MTH89596.1 TAXI family TRAP transporter solute-binding subunit [Paracoccus shanxieyensis]